MEHALSDHQIHQKQADDDPDRPSRIHGDGEQHDLSIEVHPQTISAPPGPFALDAMEPDLLSPLASIFWASAARGMRGDLTPPSVEGMDIASMIMGASIASIAWIALTPWAKLKRLKQLEAGDDGSQTSAH